MAKFSIYSSDGLTVRYAGKPKYNGSYLNVSYIEFSEISSPVPIDWHIGDYVDYSRTGLRYKLYSIPQPKKQARRNATGESFIYSNVQLHAATKQLDMALFNDWVIKDNNVHFSTSSSVSTFENVYGIASRLQECMDSYYPSKWRIHVLDSTDGADASLIATLSEAKAFSLDNGTCLGALNQIYSLWSEIGWIHTYDSVSNIDVITIGTPNMRTAANTTTAFLYGKGNGLTAIKKSYTNSDDFATRLYVYGNTTNLIHRYYNGKDILNADSVDIQNLMIPISHWGTSANASGVQKPDARLAYIEDAAKVAKYGLIPKRAYFDGSDNDDIYPSIKNLTVGILRSAKTEAGDTTYIPSTAIYADDSERLDVVKSVVNPQDAGKASEGGSKFNETQDITFSVNQTIVSNIESVTQLASASLSSGGTIVAVSDGIKGSIQFEDELNSIDLVLRITNSASEKNELEIPYEITKTRVGDLCSFTLPTISLFGSVGSNITVAIKCTPHYKNPNADNPNKDSISAVGTSNNGIMTIAETKMTIGVFYKLGGTFNMTIKQIGFDISQRATTSTDGNGSIVMVNGMCGSRTFVIKSCTYQSATDDWLLSLARATDSGNSLSFPNSAYQIEAGDQFVITDIEMPELYIGVASQRLYDAGLAMYEKLSKGVAYYEPEVDAKVIATSAVVLKEGMYMAITDSDIIEGDSDLVLIDTLSIAEDDGPIPTYKVTLREKKKTSFVESASSALAQLDGKVELALRSSAESGVDIIGSDSQTLFSDGNVLSSLRSEIEFLSKKKDDIVKGLIKFLAGAKFGNFAPGITGFGGSIDASGNGELESLSLRRFLEVPELRYNRTDINVGNQWRASGGGMIESVVADYDANGNILTTGTVTLHLEDGEIGTIAVNDLCQGIFHDESTSTNNESASADDGKGNFKFAGFYTCYFKVTEIVEAVRNSVFKYSLRPVSTNWTGTLHPCVSMNFVAYGNTSDTSRQSSRYSTLTYERYLKGVNDWEYTANNIGAQFGDLSNLSIFGLNMTGYSAYLNNIYMSGVIKQFEDLPTELKVETAGDFLSVGESVTVSWKVMKGLEDLTGQYTFSMRRYARDFMDDTWNSKHTHVNTPLSLARTSGSDTDIIGNVDNVFTLIGKPDGTGFVVNKSFTIHKRPIDGVDGKDGTNGETTYFHVKYSDNSDGTDMNETGGKYIGTYVDYTQADSTDKTKYTWVLIKGDNGAQGIAGTNGQNGETSYLHIAYANSSDGQTGFSVSDSAGKLYIGQYTDFLIDDSTDPSKYNWTLIKGDTGAQGDKGDKGLQGMIVRTSEWAEGVAYHNDDALTDAVRYLDIAIVTTGVNSFTAYQCKLSHTSSSSIPVTNTTYWQVFNTLAPIYTPLIMAQNALLRFAQTNQLLVMQSDGTTVAAGMGGGTYPIWAGAALPAEAPFRVAMDGTVYGTKMNISGDSVFSGKLNAVTGTFLSLDCRDSNNKIVGYIHFNASNNKEIEFSTDSFFSFYGDINTHYGDINMSGTKATSDGTNIDRPVRLISRDLWCKGTFGAAKRASIIVKGAYVQIYPYGLDDSRYTTYYLTSVSASPNYYRLPCRYTIDSESDGFAVDTIIFITSADYNYVFSNMAVSQKITVVNANGNQSVHYYRNGSRIELNGGVGLQIKYLGNLLKPTTSGLGAGIMSLGYEDINW